MSNALSDPNQSDAEAMAKVAKLISGTKVCMLTTTDETGNLLSRPMAVIETEFAGTLWFVSHDDTRKAEQLKREPKVNVTYSSGSAWVSINGRAEIVRDPAKLKELWNGGVTAWFPEGPDSPKTVLLKVAAEGAEYWDTPGGAIVASTLSFIKSKTTGEPYKVENDRIKM